MNLSSIEKGTCRNSFFPHCLALFPCFFSLFSRVEEVRPLPEEACRPVQTCLPSTMSSMWIMWPGATLFRFRLVFFRGDDQIFCRRTQRLVFSRWNMEDAMVALHQQALNQTKETGVLMSWRRQDCCLQFGTLFVFIAWVDCRSTVTDHLFLCWKEE